jgi:hypothetical protein
MRTAALFMLAGALLVGCPKEEEAQTKSQGEESPAPAQKEAAEVTQETGQAPAQYTVELDTTKGAIVIDVRREWAPHGADRFYELVQNGYFTDVAFFRVISGFMAQGVRSASPTTPSRPATRAAPRRSRLQVPTRAPRSSFSTSPTTPASTGWALRRSARSKTWRRLTRSTMATAKAPRVAAVRPKGRCNHRARQRVPARELPEARLHQER